MRHRWDETRFFALFKMLEPVGWSPHDKRALYGWLETVVLTDQHRDWISGDVAKHERTDQQLKNNGHWQRTLFAQIIRRANMMSDEELLHRCVTNADASRWDSHTEGTLHSA